MQKIKIAIALAAIAALTLAIVGLAAAQSQPGATTTPNPTAGPNPDFWGWMGNCFGFRANQPYGNQYVAPPNASTGPAPAPYSGGYCCNGYGYGYGHCIGW